MSKDQIKSIINDNSLILMQGGVVETLRRSGKVSFHPDLIHSPLIYDEHGSIEMKTVFKSYIDLANKTASPFVVCTPTWRANKQNVFKSGVNVEINQDAVKFMQSLKQEYPLLENKLVIGGTIGPKNDCYQPDQGLSAEEAEEFHEWQIEELVKGGAQFVIAETIPNVTEALGIAKACSKKNINYIISFVIARDGRILDQTDINTAIKYIDSEVERPPLGYFINCAHPSFLCADKQPKEVFDRLIGFMGNASDLDHCDLDNATQLHTDAISNWGNEMLTLNHVYGVKILGGCCGTNAEHINYMRTHQ
ncbi:homocysteine S-methyltransferase family protein [Zhouia amylolytica]|uniref:Hcy-binding domain-containing protein n=1 Tax=Zhouia amylolytica AD3 TaxID=1286632 RepID=W2ULC0_9FLAO|nr:homocysteine S-methyltransferase family protein [Zhouia amylolytica]ETN94754.1 hypothetical protein P278_26970 [Zhouia amylolytica AD3]MCQ0110936.1 homocysteine S-methyltransferase family protein [Zhouia amylolytica]